MRGIRIGLKGRLKFTYFQERHMDGPHADTHSQAPGEPALWLITRHLGLRLSPLQAGEASRRYDLLKEPELPAPLKHKQVEESKWNFYRC